MISKQHTIASTRPPIPVAKSLKVAGFTILLFGAIGIHPFAPMTALVGLGVWSLLGTKQALQSLSLMVLIKFSNSSVYEFSGPFELVAWATLGTAGLRIIFDNMRLNAIRHPVLPWLWLFAVAVLIQSFLVSQHSVVSVFKITAFVYMTTIILLGFKVTTIQKVEWESWFLGLWLAVMTLSLPTLLFRQIGFHVNDEGFQGILNHPQVFGVAMAPVVAWLMGTLLFSTSKRGYWLYLVIPLAWSLMYLSQARTATIAVVASLFVVFVAALWNRPVWRSRIVEAMQRPFNILLALVFLAIVVSQASFVLEKTMSFVLKQEEGKTISQSFAGSRGQLIGGQWQDFKENPLLGIGFGVSRDESFKPIFDPLTGLPISASVEKGFLPSAILQETGIFGTFFFVLLLFSLIRHVFTRTDIILSWVFMTCLFVNFGEMIFFSPNGFGLYIWLLIGWATSRHWEKRLAP